MTYVISGRNINDLYPQALHFVQRDGVIEESRAGQVKVVPFPVMTVTEKPMERVLFDEKRDANPFFHLFECLWMLNGDNDGTWLDRFVGDFSSRFGEDDGQIHGAYGKRWRSWFGQDQLDITVERLRSDPKDRRVVISMWSGDDDLQTLQEKPLKDVPCNTHIYPRIVNGVLDITVCVRSNDVIFGAYGANAVHMTFLQEYLAGRIGVPVGKFYQMSNNWHAYTNSLDKYLEPTPLYTNFYTTGRVTPRSIMTTPEKWDENLAHFMDDPENCLSVKNMWFYLTARPAWMAHLAYKEKSWKECYDWLECIEAKDWQVAMHMWITRRHHNWEKKHAG